MSIAHQFGQVCVDDDGRIHVDIQDFDAENVAHWQAVRDFGTPEVWVRAAWRSYHGEKARSQVSLVKALFREARGTWLASCRESTVARKMWDYLEQVRDAIGGTL